MFWRSFPEAANEKFPEYEVHQISLASSPHSKTCAAESYGTMASLKTMAREAKKVKKPLQQKKTTKHTASKHQFKSTEFIQESDEGDDNNSDRDSHSGDEPPLKTPVKIVQKTNGKLPPPSGSSSSSESESDEDNGSEEEEEESSASDNNVSPIPEPVK